MSYKVPESVLVVIHSPALEVLMIERADRAGYWQSVTGSLDAEDEAPAAAALREVAEETGIVAPPSALRDWRIQNRFQIYDWRLDRKSTRLNSSHSQQSRMPSSA